MSLVTTIRDNFVLPNCIYNASGALCTSTEELQDLYHSNAGAVLSKSCTLHPRQGNPEPRYYGWTEKTLVGDNSTSDEIFSFSINSMGIPNHGVEYYKTFAETHYKELIDNSPIMEMKKPFVISLSGLSVEENIKLLFATENIENVSAIELNVSCPNIVGKPQLGYDFEGLREFLLEVSKKFWPAIPLGLKLPPYFDFAQFEAVAQIIREFPKISYIVCSNSLGNGLWIDTDTETVVIKPKNGFGGVGGSVMKATTLANVHKFYELLGEPSLVKYPTVTYHYDYSETTEPRKPVAIIGCGGVTTGKDVFDLILAGASAVQIGTQLVEEGPVVFERCTKELISIMEKKGYKQLSDFRGKLKYL